MKILKERKIENITLNKYTNIEEIKELQNTEIKKITKNR